MESKTVSVPTMPIAQLETVISRPHDGLHVISWGSRDNNPTDTGIQIGAKLRDFQRAEKIGPISDGVPKRDVPGGPVTTWEFVYHFPNFSLISYLRGENLNDFDTHDPDSKFFDVIPKTRILLGKVLPEQFAKHAQQEAFPVSEWEGEKLDRYEVLLDSYKEWKIEGGGFKDFESPLFARKLEHAFTKVSSAVETQDFEPLKTKESNRAYNFFIDYIRTVIGLEPDEFLAMRDELVKDLGKGLVEVASDGSDIFSFFQIKDDPEAYVVKKTQDILKRLSQNAAEQFTYFINQIINEQGPTFFGEIDRTSLYELEAKRPEFKKKFRDMAYKDFLQISPVLLLSNPHLEDPFGSGSILDQLIDAWVSTSVQDKSFFGRAKAELKKESLPHYQKHFMETFFSNYMSGGFEPSAASELYRMAPDAIKRMKSQPQSDLHKTEVLDLLKRLEKLPAGQVLFSDYESTRLTGENLKSALASTMKNVFDETFVPGGKTVVQSMMDETARIEASASQVYRVSRMANMISGFDYAFFDGSYLVPSPQALITTVPKRTECVIDVEGKQYILSEKEDVATLVEMSKGVLFSPVIRPVSEEKNAIYAKVGRELEELSKIAERLSGSDPAAAIAGLKAFVENLSWSKDVPEYNAAQSALYSRLIDYLSGLSESLPSKLPSKLRAEKASLWSSDKAGFASELDGMDKSGKAYTDALAVLEQVDSVILKELAGKAVAPVIKEGLDRAMDSMRPFVVTYPVSIPFKRMAYEHFTGSAVAFYSKLLSNVASLASSLEAAAPEARVPLWEACNAGIKSAYDEFVGTCDARFLDDTESFFSGMGGLVEKATHLEELSALGIGASAVSSRVVYMVVGDGVVRKYTEDEMHSLEAVSRLWTQDRVSGLVEKRMRDAWETGFFAPLKASLEDNSRKGADLRTGSDFLHKYQDVRAELGTQFPDAPILQRIDAFYQKSKWGDKLEDIKDHKDRWERMARDLDGLRKDVSADIDKEYKRFRKTVLLSQADQQHPFFKHSSKVSMKPSRYNDEEVLYAVGEALKGDVPSNMPFLSLEASSSEKIATEMKGTMRSLLGGLRGNKSRSKDVLRPEPKPEFNEKYLAAYATGVMHNFLQGYFGSDPENLYRVMPIEGCNCVIVSDLNPRLDPDAVFGKGLVHTVGVDRKYVGIGLPLDQPLPSEVTSLPAYALYRARSDFLAAVSPSRAFLGAAGSRIHGSVGKATLDLMDKAVSWLSTVTN